MKRRVEPAPLDTPPQVTAVLERGGRTVVVRCPLTGNARRPCARRARARPSPVVAYRAGPARRAASRGLLAQDPVDEFAHEAQGLEVKPGVSRRLQPHVRR